MAKYRDVKAGQTEACINRLGGWDNFLRFIGGEGRVVFESILTLVRTVPVAAQPAVTTSKEYFEEAGVRTMGSNFGSQFIGLEVAAVDRAELAVRRLEEASPDATIRAELDDKAETSVSQFKAFLAANRGSPEWFLFYLRGKDGNLWAVGADWDAEYCDWDVDADSVEYPREWLAGHQVLSQV